MDYQEDYRERAKVFAQYGAIKRLVDEVFEPVESKKYEEFIKKLVMILEV